MLALTDAPARDFLRGLGRAIGRPSAILVASAHWETRVLTFNAVARNATIHDFCGFPPEVARRAVGLSSAIDTERGLDHGAWVPLHRGIL
jgi:4,5-DOPA dioxygenase extradiol